ncbi:MAG: hypothetical protein SVG88_12155 [Halobacteriales archaeon]|nr:hypothetical protein [Halobacteriales archaeon]
MAPETMDPEEIKARITTLREEADADVAAFEPPTDPPAADEAMDYLREGAGQAIWLYVEARVDGFVELSPEQFEDLEGAMNDWLELYARCYGVDLTAEFTIRKAAELLLETHNIKHTAEMLTQVPPREDR